MIDSALPKKPILQIPACRTPDHAPARLDRFLSFLRQPRMYTRETTLLVLLPCALLASTSAWTPGRRSVEMNDFRNITLFVSPGGSDTAGNGSSAHPFQTLMHALDVGGGTSDITLQLLPGTYSSAKDRGLYPNGVGRLRIIGSVDGLSVIDLAQFGAPFITIPEGRSAEVSISDLIIQNGWGQSAVTLSSSAPTSLSRVKFNHNGGAKVSGGGAIYVSFGINGVGPLISNCSFLNNSASGNGAAVLLSSSAQVVSCLFEGNRVLNPAGAGAGIFVGFGFFGVQPFISNCTFARNDGGQSGGGVYLGSAARIEACVFESNWIPTSASGGGGLFVSNGLEGDGAVIFDCHFYNNSARGGGGGLLLESVAMVVQCVFEDNVVPDSSNGGGAILVGHGINGRGPFISNCTFSRNVGGGGGAILLVSPARIVGCSLLDNYAFSEVFGGGAVYVNKQGAWFSNCSFHNNSAHGAGGAMFLAKAARLEACVFDNNSNPNPDQGGGAVFVNLAIPGEGPQIFNCSFRNNSAAASGGALRLLAQSHVEGCDFVDNKITELGGNGGAILIGSTVRDGEVTIENCTFHHNSGHGGGAMHIESPTRVSGCTFDTNLAAVGGGVNAASPDVAFFGCSFTNNIARVGSAIFLQGGGQISLRSCALCDAAAVGSIACNATFGAGVVEADLSSTIPVSEVVSAVCQVQMVVGTPFVLNGDALISKLYGAVCQGQATSLYTMRPANTTVPEALASMSVTVRAVEGTSLAVTRPMEDTSTPADLMRSFVHAEQAVVGPELGLATVTISNVHDGKCDAGCLPNFGMQVESPPETNPHLARAYVLEALEEGPRLSLTQSAVNVLGFPWAWVGLNSLLLVRLRNQFGQPTRQNVLVRVQGEDVLCEDGIGADGDVASSIVLCSVKFHREGRFQIELFDRPSMTRIGALHDQVTVVSLGWPIAAFVLLVLALLVVSIWCIFKAWRRRRQQATDKLLANYVGLGQHDGANSMSTLLEDSNPRNSGKVVLDKSFLIPFSAIDIRRDIAAGAQGKVSLGTWKGTSVAVKRLYTAMFTVDDEERRQGRATFIKELALHKSLRHPNVVQLLGVCADPLCIVLEFMERGSLFGCLQERETLDMPWSLRLRCALDIARAMSYLHAEEILHRDLKSLNVLVNYGWRCKVADFDQSRAGACTMTATVGTALWCAPEVLDGHGEYGKAADIYSFGIVMFECWTREGPFQGRGFEGQYLTMGRMRGAVYAHILDGGRPVCSDAHGEPPEAYGELMRRCWDGDAGRRPTFDQAVEELEAAAQATPAQRPPLQRALGVLGGRSSGAAPSGSRHGWRDLLRLHQRGSSTELGAPLLPLSAEAAPEENV